MIPPAVREETILLIERAEKSGIILMGLLFHLFIVVTVST